MNSVQSVFDIGDSVWVLYHPISHRCQECGQFVAASILKPFGPVKVESVHITVSPDGVFARYVISEAACEDGGIGRAYDEKDVFPTREAAQRQAEETKTSERIA